MEPAYDLRSRIVACAWTQNVDDPPRWVNAHIGRMIGDDWVAAWESALVGHDPETIGRDESVITDQHILSAVQHAATQ
jgi:hypothetical protein